MAARRNRHHAAEVIEKIRITQLLNRLQDNGLGELRTPDDKPYSLGKSEVTSITWLLERVLPRAEAPKQIDLNGNLNLTVVTGVPGG